MRSIRIFNKVILGLTFAALFTGCGGGGGEEGTDVSDTQESSTVCNKVYTPSDVYIVNLSQDSSNGQACTDFGDTEGIAQCIEDRIRAKFANAPACLNAFDVFVPGTTQENGNYKQFTSIISDQPGRTYLPVQYREKADTRDAAEYNGGVTDASKSLDALLYTLKTRFNSPDVRVFGHSKGSDAVAQVSLYRQHSDVQFYAFAQPGATPAMVKGQPGFIQKVTDNLVTITWRNDEVQYYSGLIPPEIWGWPGYVNQEAGGATIPVVFRIDHHNNYGGSFSQGGLPVLCHGS